jgi:HAD superfamily hydrolase (TIGR01459 family)
VTQIIADLGAVAGRYEVLLCDVWGVIHDGVASFPAPCAALARWRAERGPVVLISNAPRPWASVAEQLDGLGVPRASWSAVVTSGDVTRDLLAARAPGPAWRIGPDKDAPLFEGLGLEFTNSEGAAFIACTGPEHDEIETPEDYRERLSAAAARGLEMICANPDRLVQRGDKLVFCGGALADLYASLGGAVVMAGKPFAPIYDLALRRAEETGEREVARGRVLAIGDGLATDIAGANAQNLDALFVAGGIHAAEVRGADGPLDPGALAGLLTAAGVAARYAMDALSW